MQNLDEKSKKEEPSVEDTIYEDAITLVRHNLSTLLKARTLDEDGIDLLAKLVRIYGSLKDDLRADNKDGIKSGSST